jgi:hypothetical protein
MMQNHSRRMQRLLAAGLLPGRAGQPVRAWAHLSLAELLALDDRRCCGTGPDDRIPVRRRRHRAPAPALDILDP